MSELDEQITLCRNELQHYPEGHPNRANLLHVLARLLCDRFDQRGEIADIDEAIALTRTALELRPQGHSHRACSLHNVVNSLYSCFTQFVRPSDLEEAHVLRRSALELPPQEHLDRTSSLCNLANFLRSRFSQLGRLSDLEEAIALERSALELCPQGHPDRARSLCNLANSLWSRFNQLGGLPDLEEAISLERSALELCPQGHPDRTHPLASLVISLRSRFNQLGQLSDLEEVVSLQRSALELYPQDHPDRAYSLGDLVISLRIRFNQLGRLPDLEEALSLQRSVLELRPQGHPERAHSLGTLAASLRSHFYQLGRLPDLEEALSLQRGALELYPQGHPHRAYSLGDLAASLRIRFDQLGRLSDLEEAIALERSALELRPQGHPDRAQSLGDLAISLGTRFNQLGRLPDLEEALSLQRGVLELRPQGDPDRAHSLASLATSLRSHFSQLGRLPDLEEALSLQRGALELYPQGHPHRAQSLGSLVTSLGTRFNHLGRLSDLEEAIALERSALELCPQGHPDRAHSLGTLAASLRGYFYQLGRLPDLEEALSLERSALELFPQGHPDRALTLGNLAGSLYSRFEQFRSPSDLEEAIALQRSALELCPQGHPDRALSLDNIARFLHARFQHSPVHNIGDLQETFSVYSQLSEVSDSVTVFLADLRCAKEWIKKAEECKHSTTVLAYQTFLRLSVHHLATLPSLPQNLALLKQLATSLAIDAFSACLRYDNPTNAIEFLEQGRGVFWSQLVRLRSPLDDVAASGDTGKELAEKFTQVASSLRDVSDAPPDVDSQHDRAWRLGIQLQDVVADIRQLSGLSHFLQPPCFSDLQVAAAAGPVIIVNASQYSCDALLLLSHQDPVHVPLPITKADVSELSLQLRSLVRLSKFSDVKREIMVFLRELWDVIVFPIVNILQQFCPHRSRIWWCPTAEFSLLPLHAAGSFRKGQPMLSDLYISSYTLTLTALIRARQERSSDPSTERHRFLIIGQAQAPGQSAHASVNTELSSISQRVGSVATLTCVQDQDATIAKVGEEMSKNDFVHLACHGIPDRKHPFESGFALGDGLFKVENIMRYDLQNAKFAYLSACHTTVGDEESPDEVIHLATAMQFAGFRSVIGTMWAVDDAHTNEITSKFYDNMIDESGRLDHSRAALALHRTMRSVWSSDIPFDQRILYIHIGA